MRSESGSQAPGCSLPEVEVSELREVLKQLAKVQAGEVSAPREVFVSDSGWGWLMFGAGVKHYRQQVKPE